MHYDPYGCVIRRDPEGSLPSPVPPFTSALPALRGPLRAWAWARDNFSKQHVPWPFCSRLRLVLLPRPSLPRGRAGAGVRRARRSRVTGCRRRPTCLQTAAGESLCPLAPSLPFRAQSAPTLRGARSLLRNDVTRNGRFPSRP